MVEEQKKTSDEEAKEEKKDEEKPKEETRAETKEEVKEETKEKKPGIEKIEKVKGKVEKEVKVPAKFKKLVEEIEKMSVKDLAELVKILEEKFGVSPMAAVSAAAPTAAASKEEGGEEKSVFTVELKDAGSQKIQVIKAIREITGKGLKECKDLADKAPQVVKENVKKEEAEEIKKKLEQAGATVELK